MMASRRCPSATPPAASTHTSPASGPRWRTLSIMASQVARSVSAVVAARQSIMPAMPHIPTLQWTIALIAFRDACAGHGSESTRDHRRREPIGCGCCSGLLLPYPAAQSGFDILPQRGMRPQARRRIHLLRPQSSGRCIARSSFEKGQGGDELQIRVRGIIVHRTRSKPRLIKHITRVDAFIDEMHGDPEIARIPFCICPISAVHPAIFRGDAGVIVDEGRLDRLQHFLRDDTGPHYEDRPRLQTLQMRNTFERVDRWYPNQVACVGPSRLEVRLPDNFGDAPSRNSALHALKRHEGELPADANESQPLEPATQQQRAWRV